MRTPKVKNFSLSHNKLALSAAVTAALLSGYGSRPAYAGSCTSTAGTYSCTGAANSATDTTETLSASSLTITTTEGFGIETRMGNAFSLNIASGSSDSLSFNDQFMSSITGASYGIIANNNGSGALSITTTGTVIGTAGSGIYANNENAGTNLSLTTAAVTGANNGIYAVNYGLGALSITSTGAVIGTTLRGIDAANTATGTSLTIATAAVTGATDGIFAFNDGSGALSITSTGTVTGTTGTGINASNSATATSLTLVTAAVTGANNGISATNSGSGALSITSTGTVTSTTARGIYADNRSIGTSLSLVTAAVTGATDGIFATNYGGSNITIIVNGAVSGGSGTAIRTAGNSQITLNNGASVMATSGNAISNNSYNATVTVNTGASVTGSIVLGAGDDTIDFAGGDFSAVTLFDGGDGTNDTLRFSGSSGGIDQALFSGIENLSITSGSTINFTGANALMLNSFSTLNLLAGGVLDLRQGNNATGDTTTLTGDFVGGGQLLIDIDTANDSADTFVITGNVTGAATSIAVSDIALANTASGNDITLVTVNGTKTAGDFSLSAPVVNGAFNYNTLALIGDNFVLQSLAIPTPPVTTPPVTPTGGNTGGNTPPRRAFTDSAAAFESIATGLLSFSALPSYQQRISSRSEGAASSGDASAAWIRIAGGQQDRDFDSSSTNAKTDSNYWLAQIGIDTSVYDDSRGELILGVNASYGNNDTDINSDGGSSTIDNESYSLGLSATWLLASGRYLDSQAQYSWYQLDIGSSLGNVDDLDGNGYGLSAELGKDIALNNSWTLSPQVQLAYSNTKLDNFTGASKEQVSTGNNDSLTARLGARLSKQFANNAANQGFIIANIVHEFEDETDVNISGTRLSNSGTRLSNSVDQWTAQLGGGISYNWQQGSTHYQTYASVTFNSSLEKLGDSTGTQGDIGLKLSF